MKRQLLTFFVPPIAVCRYGCAGCCAAPIGVMWFAGIVSIIYGFAGGPAASETVSWTTVGLGVLLWIIAVTWAFMVVRGVSDDKTDPKCSQKRSTICSIVKSDDDSDPMSDIKNLTQ